MEIFEENSLQLASEMVVNEEENGSRDSYSQERKLGTTQPA